MEQVTLFCFALCARAVICGFDAIFRLMNEHLYMITSLQDR